VTAANTRYYFSGLTGSNPTLNLTRGSTYNFDVNTGPTHPFWIKTSPTTGLGNAYNTGVTNNGTHSNTITFTVPSNAPNTLYYACQNHSTMQGTINIISTTTTTQAPTTTTTQASTTTTTQASTTTTTIPPPTITIASIQGTSLNRNLRTVTLTFATSENTSNFDISHISQSFPVASLSNFTTISGSSYTAIYTAPDGVDMYNDISVAAGKFTGSSSGAYNLASNVLRLTSNCQDVLNTVQIFDIPYGSHLKQKINIRFPGKTHASVTGREFVGIFFQIHGGGWANGSKDTPDIQAAEIGLAEAGYICINIGYRLVGGFPATDPSGRWPNNVNDIIEILRLCTKPNYANRENYRFNGIDYFGIISAYIALPQFEDKWFVGGSSAGGHLSTIGTLIYGKNENIWPRGVINHTGPCDLWDGPVSSTPYLPPDNDAINRGILQIHRDIIQGIIPDLNEIDRKNASPRWFIDYTNWSNAFLELASKQTTWVNICNNYDTIVPAVAILRFSYKLPSSKSRLLNVQEYRDSPEQFSGVVWRDPWVTGGDPLASITHWTSTSIQNVYIYNANRILNYNKFVYSNTTINLQSSLSIAANKMDLDLNYEPNEVEFTFSWMCSPGSSGAPHSLSFNWRTSNWSSFTYPNGDLIPDARIHSSTAVPVASVTPNSGLIQITEFADTKVTVQLSSFAGTKYLALEIYNGSGDVIAMSNLVKIIGNL
jgi:hypothetical protein